MTLPIRFTVCTYNIWTDTRWPERRTALQKFVQLHKPDILCVQELQADSKHALDEVLSATHARVEDPFEGWTREGNIYWNRAFFELVEYGAEQIGIIEEYRRMFWARLRLNDGSGRTLLVSTAHYTYPNHPQVVPTEKNVRIPQARATIAELARLREADPDEPQLFMGDLNDREVPIYMLIESGLQDCFSSLGRVSPFTFPAFPTSRGVPTTIDWLMHRGPITVMTAEVPDFFDGDLSPSDHKPIIATFAL
jgi:endonuclease/exonuclease/phosphatase family metal-dependent hydrolase